jgi:hypothetical protein
MVVPRLSPLCAPRPSDPARCARLVPSCSFACFCPWAGGWCARFLARSPTRAPPHRTEPLAPPPACALVSHHMRARALLACVLRACRCVRPSVAPPPTCALVSHHMRARALLACVSLCAHCVHDFFAALLPHIPCAAFVWFHLLPPSRGVALGGQDCPSPRSWDPRARALLPLCLVCVCAFDFLIHPLAPRAPPRWHSRSTRHQGSARPCAPSPPVWCVCARLIFLLARSPRGGTRRAQLYPTPR